MNANVIVPTQNKIQKGEFLLAFFYACHKNLQWSLQWMFNELLRQLEGVFLFLKKFKEFICQFFISIFTQMNWIWKIWTKFISIITVRFITKIIMDFYKAWSKILPIIINNFSIISIKYLSTALNFKTAIIFKCNFSTGYWWKIIAWIWNRTQ